MKKYFFKSLMLLSVISVVAFSAQFVKADNLVPTVNHVYQVNADGSYPAYAGEPVTPPVFTFVVLGSNFANGATVNINNQTFSTNFITTGILEISMSSDACSINSAGQFIVDVYNPAPGGGFSKNIIYERDCASGSLSGGNGSNSGASCGIICGNSSGSNSDMGQGSSGTAFGLNDGTGNGSEVGNGGSSGILSANNPNPTLTSPVSPSSTLSSEPSEPINYGLGVVPAAQDPGVSVPIITSITPTFKTIGNSAVLTITITGLNFSNVAGQKSYITFGATRIQTSDTTYTPATSPTQLAFTVPAAQYASSTLPRDVIILVNNPGPNSVVQSSNSAHFQFRNGSDPLIYSINPTSTTAGGAAFNLTVTGNNFNTPAVNGPISSTAPTTSVLFNGLTTGITTTRNSNTTLTVSVPASKIASAGVILVTVRRSGFSYIDNNSRRAVVVPQAISNTVIFIINSANVNASITTNPTSASLNSSSQTISTPVLQQFLDENGFPVATNGPGSIGNETNYFGTATTNALCEFQKSQGLSVTNPNCGKLGPWTTAIINQIQQSNQTISSSTLSPTSLPPQTPVSTALPSAPTTVNPTTTTTPTNLSPVVPVPTSTTTPPAINNLTPVPTPATPTTLANPNCVDGTLVCASSQTCNQSTGRCNLSSPPPIVTMPPIPTQPPTATPPSPTTITPPTTTTAPAMTLNNIATQLASIQNAIQNLIASLKGQ